MGGFEFADILPSGGRAFDKNGDRVAFGEEAFGAEDGHRPSANEDLARKARVHRGNKAAGNHISAGLRQKASGVTAKQCRDVAAHEELTGDEILSANK